jgi:outer membrane protein assembly factor BamB
MLLAFVASGSLNNGSCETTEAAQRPIVNSTISVHPLWSRAVNIDNMATSSFLASTQNLLIAARYCQNQSDPEVTAFDWNTGQVIWNTDAGNDIYDLILDAHRNAAYMEETDQIQAVALRDGSPLWTNQTSLYSHKGHRLQVLPDGRVITYVNGIWQVDPTDGSLKTMTLPKATFFFDGDTAYLWGPVEQNRFLYIQAVDINTGQSRWKVGTYLQLGSPFDPYATEGILVYRDDGIQTNLVVVDKTTGHLLWKIEDDPEHAIISNTVVSDGILYALDHRARLLLFDAKTGSQRGVVEFKRPNRAEDDLLYQPGAIGGSQLAVEGNRVAVYFQDAHVLSIFEISLPNAANLTPSQSASTP